MKKKLNKEELKKFLKDLEDTEEHVKNMKWDETTKISKEDFEENRIYTLALANALKKECREKLKKK